MTTHFKGPVSGAKTAWAGGGADVPIDAISHDDWVVYHNDFIHFADYDATNDWTLTQVSAGGSAAINALPTLPNGVLVLDCPANLDGPIVQFDKNRMHYLAAASSATVVATETVFACRFSVLDVSTSSVFVGLAESESGGTGNVLTTPTAGTTSDTHIGFVSNNVLAGAFTATAAGSVDTTAVTTAGVFTLTDGDWIDVAVRAVGQTEAHFYYRPVGRSADSRRTRRDWIELPTLTTTEAWDASMFPTFAVLGAAAGDDLYIDRIVWAVKRDLTI